MTKYEIGADVVKILLEVLSHSIHKKHTHSEIADVIDTVSSLTPLISEEISK
jgi:hypothetical protein